MSAPAPPGKTAAPDDLREGHFIGAQELARQLAEGAAPVLLDIRFRPGLAQPEAEYDAGHLPGAHYVHLPAVLADAGPHWPAVYGALPLPEVDTLQHALRSYGINNDSAVVVYDNRHGLSAARAWWVLKWAGLVNVRVLDGGYGYWQSLGLPITTQRPDTGAGSIALNAGLSPVSGNLATIATDEAAAFPHSGILLDAREREHFVGTPGDPPAHIPGAITFPSSSTLDENGLLLPSEVLRAQAEAVGLTPGAAVGTYCGAGVLAAHKVLTLATLGIEAALYVGSWSAWSASAAGREPEGQ
jgi:thiosulfate/3-mercaptopyruvate sulfurtransferase